MMRVMLDTNVLISMCLFPGPKFSRMLQLITEQHTLILSSFVVNELLAVADRKFPDRKPALDSFLSKLSYELVYTPLHPAEGLFTIRDSKDYPVLYTAIVEDVDILITGDKDFQNLGLETPEILTPAEFLEKYDV